MFFSLFWKKGVVFIIKENKKRWQETIKLLTVICGEIYFPKKHDGNLLGLYLGDKIIM